MDGVRQWLAVNGAEATPARVAEALRAQGKLLGDAEVLGAADQLRPKLAGTGPLGPLLADLSVTDVLVSAPDRVWVDRGAGLELTGVRFESTSSCGGSRSASRRWPDDAWTTRGHGWTPGCRTGSGCTPPAAPAWRCGGGSGNAPSRWRSSWRRRRCRPAGTRCFGLSSTRGCRS